MEIQAVLGTWTYGNSSVWMRRAHALTPVATFGGASSSEEGYHAGRRDVAMGRANQQHLSLATALLAREAAGDGDARTHAAGRVYDKLYAHLTPLLGKTGVELLLVRSAKLVQGELEFLTEASILDGADQLRDRLRPPAPALAIESAAGLFANFLGLLMTFIGERLTNQILRNAWPTLVGVASEEQTS